MSVTEIKAAIAGLPPMQLADLMEWIDEYEEETWDRRIEQDVKAGRFEGLRQRVRDARQAGECRPL